MSAPLSLLWSVCHRCVAAMWDWVDAVSGADTEIVAGGLLTSAAAADDWGGSTGREVVLDDGRGSTGGSPSLSDGGTGLERARGRSSGP